MEEIKAGSLKNIPSAGDEKVNEYVRRIQSGEKGIFDGLPDSFRKAVEERLGETESDQKSPLVPPQYAGLSSEIVDMLWDVPEFVDKEKTVAEQERKIEALAYLRSQEVAQSGQEEQERNEGERITEIIKGLASPKDTPEQKEATDEFGQFRMKHGTTAGGEFTWFEYRNKTAKKMKESGTFEWGKERIYFDIAPEQFEQLRDLLMQIAGKEKIPIGFKYLDMEETRRTSPQSIDGKETWFVANFATQEDAKKCYDALTQAAEYASLPPGRNLSYQGIRLDQCAEYASGFREARGALERMMRATSIGGGMYEYDSDDGGKIRIRAEDLGAMKKQDELLQKTVEDARKFWNK